MEAVSWIYPDKSLTVGNEVAEEGEELSCDWYNDGAFFWERSIAENKYREILKNYMFDKNDAKLMSYCISIGLIVKPQYKKEIGLCLLTTYKDQIIDSSESFPDKELGYKVIQEYKKRYKLLYETKGIFDVVVKEEPIEEIKQGNPLNGLQSNIF